VRDNLGGKLVTFTPIGRGALPTAPGIASQGWSHHVVTRLASGEIIDAHPDVAASFPSLAAYQQAVFTAAVNVGTTE
jgi:hypothetical protein